MSEVRVYPSCCTSAFCGRIECPQDCKCLPTLVEFTSWRERTGAIVSDPVWCPTVYVAREAGR